MLVETGVHEDYVEHWRRDSVAATPCGALFLVAPDGQPGLLVRVGALFGWAGGGTVVIDSVDGPRWNELGITGKQVQANGVRWTVETAKGT